MYVRPWILLASIPTSFSHPSTSSKWNVIPIDFFFFFFSYFILCLLRFSRNKLRVPRQHEPSSVTPIPSLLLYVRLCLTIWIVTVRKLNLCESFRESWRIEEKYLKRLLTNIFIQTKERKKKRKKMDTLRRSRIEECHQNGCHIRLTR